MKKMLLGASALLLGGVALAQSPISSIKSNPWAGPHANYGKSEQYGTENKVRVRQAGQNQEVYTFQADGEGKGGNLAAVTQISMPGDKPNYATTVQLGTKNQATSLQVGAYNTSGIYQGTADSGSKKNKAFVDQKKSKKSTSIITQDGDKNLAASQQRGKKHSSSIAQVGVKNQAYAIQKGKSGHTSTIEQDGKLNMSTVHQIGAGQNAALTSQVGQSNTAFQWQEATNAGYGNGGIIVQGIAADDTADDTVANKTGNLKGHFDGFEPTNTYAKDNKAAQYQYGNDNSALISQFGEENVAEQIQNGYSNAAVIGQDGVHNYAKQDQEGNSNAAGIIQVGKHNKAYQRQYGNSNVAASYQEGKSNKVNTYQEGNQLVALTSQTGKMNSALVVQKGDCGQAYEVIQSGNGNIADIMQLDGSSCGDFNANKVECEFPDITVPSCPIDIPDLDIKDPCPGC